MASNMKKELRAALAEFLATMLFVFFGVGAVNGMVRNHAPTKTVGDPINYATAFGFSITALAYSIGDVSGGHINPAVTLTMAITQKDFTWMRCAMYMVAQFLGGLVGGGFLCAAQGGYDTGTFLSGIGINPPNVNAIKGVTAINSGEAFLFEFFGTLILLFTVYNVAHWSSNAPQSDLQKNTFGALAPIPIGLSVFVAHLTLGPYTGCGINPARVLGAVVWERGFWDGDAGEYFWVYFVGPFLASLVAPALYYALYGTLKPGSEISSEGGASKVAVASKPSA